MSVSGIALVGATETATQVVQHDLESRWQTALLAFTFAELPQVLQADNDGVLLVVRDCRDHDREIAHLIQDIALQKWPLAIAVVELGDERRELTPALNVYLDGRYRWPDEAERLVRQLSAYRDCACPFVRRDSPPLQMLRRQLQQQTPSLAPLVDRIALAAKHDVTVLLTGETGTGKTFCAHLLHDHSPRRQHRLLHVSCGAVPANLIASEFFGHVKGAFTGADRSRVGKFAAVGQGTLLLDEIDTLGLEQQAALLRVIETGEFEPVGSEQVLKCAARLIVASNVSLEEAVDSGRFRADLYYRLNVMSFHLPPLRERVRDIAPLAQAMAARFNRKFDKDLFDISPQAMAALESYAWPGNLRQLENAIQHGVLLCQGPELRLQDLPDAIQDCALLGEATGEEDAKYSLHEQRDSSERLAILRALVKSGYNRSRAAEMLGISRVTLYKKMDKYGLSNIPLDPQSSAL